MRFFFVVLLFCLATISTSCSSEQGVGEKPTEISGQEQQGGADVQADYVMKYIETAEDVSTDLGDAIFTTPGEIAEQGEPIEIANAMVKMVHDGEYVYLYLEVASAGWVSVGFNQVGGGMNGATMIVGYYDDNGMPFVREDVGQGHQHSEVTISALGDYGFGGSPDLIILEFVYPIDFPSNQGYNLDGLVRGETYALIYATNTDSGDISRPHNVRGAVTFIVD